VIRGLGARGRGSAHPGGTRLVHTTVRRPSRLTALVPQEPRQTNDNQTTSTTVIQIQPLSDHDRPWTREFLVQQAGATRMVSRGRLHSCDELPGFAAILDGAKVGLLNYRIDGSELEVVTLYCAVRRRGVGSALLAAATASARRAGCSRLWLVTTNDNTRAIAFYRRRGMKLAAVHRDALVESRKLKPEIPLIGHGGETIRDEVEFEILLSA